MQQTQKEGTALPMYIKSLQTSQPGEYTYNTTTTCALIHIFNYQQI